MKGACYCCSCLFWIGVDLKQTKLKMMFGMLRSQIITCVWYDTTLSLLPSAPSEYPMKESIMLFLGSNLWSRNRWWIDSVTKKKLFSLPLHKTDRSHIDDHLCDLIACCLTASECCYLVMISSAWLPFALSCSNPDVIVKTFHIFSIPPSFYRQCQGLLQAG